MNGFYKLTLLNKMEEEKIAIELPKGFMNCVVSKCNHFIADTNDSKNWDTLKFPLPKPKGEWYINGYHGDKGKFEVELVDIITQESRNRKLKEICGGVM